MAGITLTKTELDLARQHSGQNLSDEDINSSAELTDAGSVCPIESAPKVKMI